MKISLFIALGLLVCALRATAEPVTFASDFAAPDGTAAPRGNPSKNSVVAIFRNNVALCAVAPGARAAQERLAGIVISPAAEKLLPAGSLAGMDPAQVAKVVQKLVGENPALIAQLVAIALRDLGAGDTVTRETIIQAALAGLTGPQQNIGPLAQVLALLASELDADLNASALITAKNALVKNGVLAADSTSLEEMLVDMKVLEITEAPAPGENEGSFGSGDQGAGDVGSVPSGGSGGGAAPLEPGTSHCPLRPLLHLET